MCASTQNRSAGGDYVAGFADP
ncbi:MAG: hypothetical protein QOG89_415, partial [Thermomicrobiales bacterium]|nr:hypothetical protein [Thermomicrobiales bacterium]